MEGVGALGAHARRAPCRHHVCALRCLSSPDPCGAQVKAFYHSANPAERSAAEEVLKQLPQGASLHGVPCATVLDAGLRAAALKRCGYGLNSVVIQLAPVGAELGKLGYG